MWNILGERSYVKILLTSYGRGLINKMLIALHILYLFIRKYKYRLILNIIIVLIVFNSYIDYSIFQAFSVTIVSYKNIKENNLSMKALNEKLEKLTS